jgi:hypothetical protein
MKHGRAHAELEPADPRHLRALAIQNQMIGEELTEGPQAAAEETVLRWLAVECCHQVMLSEITDPFADAGGGRSGGQGVGRPGIAKAA